MILRNLRRWANVLLARHGLQITYSRIENDPLRQLLLSLQHHRIDFIIDVGANSGQYAQELFRSGYSGVIHSIEPQPAAHALLSHVARGNPRWTVLPPLAAGDTETDVEMLVAGNSLSSSVLPMLARHIEAAPESAPVGSIVVRQTTLDSLFADKLDRSHQILLKIDTQGYEPQVLKGAAACLQKARLVQLEMSVQSLYGGQLLWRDVVDIMVEGGFEVWSLHPEFCDPVTGQLLQVNGLFCRP
jgi:FkbM family methyltransferase